MSESAEVDAQHIPGRIAIVVSRYNESITTNLLEAALQTFRDAGVGDDRLDVAHVPGAWELPLVVSQFAHRPDCLAAVALGAVIEGETTHDQHINRSVSWALMDIGLRTGKPVLMGLLTCRNVEQAINRSGGSVGNKGVECAEAALEMIPLLYTLTQ